MSFDYISKERRDRQFKETLNSIDPEFPEGWLFHGPKERSDEFVQVLLKLLKGGPVTVRIFGSESLHEPVTLHFSREEK